VGSKLNFRSPARQVRIDTTSPDFISWDDINGIDEVKQEIQVGYAFRQLWDPCLAGQGGRLRGSQLGATGAPAPLPGCT
jgi:cell division protease FtsH